MVELGAQLVARVIALAIRYWFWIVIAAMVAAIGVQNVRINSAHGALSTERAERATETAQRATAYAADSDKTAKKETTHAAAMQTAADTFAQAQPEREARLAADLQRANRLLSDADRRAAGYRAQADAGAAACSRLADRAEALDRMVATGLDVVERGRAVVERRDAEIALLLGVIMADRALLDQAQP